MMRIAVLALMIGALCSTAMSQQAAEFRSYYAGNRYDFRLTHKQLLNTPAWLEDAWRLEEIKLVPLSERWVYVVSLTPPPPPNCYDCMASPFSIVVTMDGNAVTAVVSPWKPTSPSAQ